MPTAKGLPRKGDKMVHVETGEIVTVVKRESDSIPDCSVIVSYDSGRAARNPVYGYPKNCMRVTEIMYWLQHNRYRFQEVQ